MKNRNMILLAVVSASFALVACNGGAAGGNKEVTEAEFNDKVSKLSTDNPYSKLTVSGKSTTTGTGLMETSDEEEYSVSYTKNSEGNWVNDADSEDIAEAEDVQELHISVIAAALKEENAAMAEELNINLEYKYYANKDGFKITFAGNYSMTTASDYITASGVMTMSGEATFDAAGWCTGAKTDMEMSQSAIFSLENVTYMEQAGGIHVVATESYTWSK